MGSAFQQVQPRGSPPRPSSSNAPGKRPRRERQASSLHMWSIIEEPSTVDEVPSVPDQVSISASEASNSTPPLLADFIDATCSASAWFTSCFPCAVIDINDENDNSVMDKLSPKEAMNTMYHGPTFSSFVSDGNEPSDGNGPALVESDDPNVMILHMEQPRPVADTIEEDEDGEMDDVSLEPIPQDYEQIVSILPSSSESRVQTPESEVQTQSVLVTPKKKFSVKKMFGKKSKPV